MVASAILSTYNSGERELCLYGMLAGIGRSAYRRCNPWAAAELSAAVPVRDLGAVLTVKAKRTCGFCGAMRGQAFAIP